MKTTLISSSLVVWAAVLGQAGAAAAGKSIFETGVLPTGLPGNVEIPCLAADAAGTIWCTFSHDIHSIWIMKTVDAGRHWSRPVKVMDCLGPGYITDATVLVCPDRLRVYATYVPKDAENRFRRSRFLESVSTDGGRTWSPPTPVPIPHRYVCGKIHPPVWLDADTVVMGYSWDVPAEEGRPADSEGGMFLKSGVLISRDRGATWTPGADISVDIHPIGADEPAIVRLSNGDLFMVLRTASPHAYETRSRDGGRTWAPPQPSRFFGYNSPTALLRLRDGAVVRAWDNSPANRFPLVVALSTDDARTWTRPRILAEPEIDTDGNPSWIFGCYPSLAEAADGTILAVWWQRTSAGVNSLRYARFNRAWLEATRSMPRPFTIVAFGDSVTRGVRPGVHEYQTFRYLLERRLRKRGRRVRVVNAGVGSSTTREAKQRFERDVLAQQPDLVLIMFGINDAAVDVWKKPPAGNPRVPLAEYTETLRFFIRTLRKQGAQVVLMTPNPLCWTPQLRKLYGKPPYEVSDPDGLNVILIRYVDAIRGLAAAEHVPLVDVFAGFRKFGERPEHSVSELLVDGMHPNPKGHRLIADLLASEIEARRSQSK